MSKNYLGDFREDKTVVFEFNTLTAAQAPVAPSSAFTASDIAIYRSDGTKKTTSNGITVTSPFDSTTGLHKVSIDTSNDTGDASFWATGYDYTVALDTAKTVDSTSVDGVVLRKFSIENRSALMPTIAGRKLNVSASGVADGDMVRLSTSANAADWLEANMAVGGITVNDLGTQAKADVNEQAADALASFGANTLQRVNLPDGFDSWAIPEVTILKVGMRQYRAYVDESALTPTTTETLYVDATNGNDANDGSTLALAKQTFEAAISAAVGEAVEFRCAAGTYTINSALPTTACIIRREGAGTVNLQSTSGEVTTATGSDVLLENVTLLDRYESSGGTRFLKNVTTSVPSGDAITLHGTGKAVVLNLRNATTTQSDCVDYDDTIQAIEINSIITGTDTSAASNCSTCHGSSRVVRVNCEYYNSPRPVHDVDLSRTVNLGCRIHDSTGAAGEDTQFLLGAGFSSIGSEDVYSWVFGCTFSGTTTVDIYTDTAEGFVFVDEETSYATVSTGANITSIVEPVLELMTAAEIRAEIDANSSQLVTISAAISSLPDDADIASILAALVSINTILTTTGTKLTAASIVEIAAKALKYGAQNIESDADCEEGSMAELLMAVLNGDISTGPLLARKFADNTTFKSRTRATDTSTERTVTVD